MFFKKRKRLIMALAAGVFFFILLNLVFGGFVKNSFYFISKPFQVVFSRLGQVGADFFDCFFDKDNIKKENEEMTKEIFLLQQRVFALLGVEQENKSLRNALQVGLEKEFELVLADVIAKEVAGDIILIDKGARDGLKEKMPVITEEKVLVGIVEEVLTDFSRVALLSSKKVNFDIEIQDKENESTLGLARGIEDLGLEFYKIPMDVKIEQGYILISSNLSGKFPKGLLVGEIKNVQKSASEPFQEGAVMPYFTELDLNNLFIIKNFVQDN